MKLYRILTSLILSIGICSCKNDINSPKSLILKPGNATNVYKKEIKVPYSIEYNDSMYRHIDHASHHSHNSHYSSRI